MIEDLNAKWKNALINEPCCAGKKLVFGEGKTDHPLLMLVGEAPGAHEAEQGRPFVGKAGQNLNEFLKILSLQREDIYISNTVKIRPAVPGKNGNEKNRPPSQYEVTLFTPWLIDEIKMISPCLLVTLGNTPLKVVLGKEAIIGNCHGRKMDTTLGIPLYPLYHPAAVIYNRGLRAVYEQDLINLKGILSKLNE